MPAPHAPLAPWRQLARDDLLSRLANVPSRAEMQRPKLKADLAENVGRFYDALWRRARAEHTGHFATSWSQLATACGYEADAQVLVSLQRYAALLEEAGLVAVAGERDKWGAWRRLTVQLHEPPPIGSAARRDSSVGGATPVIACEARRRRETRSQRHQRRERPYRRSGGRGRAVPRWDLRWSTNVGSPMSVPGPRSTSSTEGPGTRSGVVETSATDLTQPPWRNARTAAGSAGLSDAIKPGCAGPAASGGRPLSPQDDAERQRIRAIVSAALEAPLVTEDHESVGALAPGSLRAWAEHEAWAHVQLERLAGKTRPSYANFVTAFSLLNIGDWRDATGPVRVELERSAARYDRYALRLLDAGQAVQHPTALRFYIAETRRRLAHDELWDLRSPGFAVRALRGRSLHLRERWRAHEDPTGEKRAAGGRRRDQRRERRVRAVANQLRAGVRVPFVPQPLGIEQGTPAYREALRRYLEWGDAVHLSREAQS